MPKKRYINKKRISHTKMLVSFLNIILNVCNPHHDCAPYFFKRFSRDWICTFDPGRQGMVVLFAF